jgi:hypothetical protein
MFCYFNLICEPEYGAELIYGADLNLNVVFAI